MPAGENRPSLDGPGMFAGGIRQAGGFAFAGSAVEAVPVVGKRYSGFTLELTLQPLGGFIALLLHACQLFLSFLG
jgi:hypothetical protein